MSRTGAWKETEIKEHAEGEALGARLTREQLLLRLRVRGLVPTEAQQALILCCRDLDGLERWSERAMTAETIAQVLEL